MHTLLLRHRLSLPHPACLSLHPSRSPGAPAHINITNPPQSEWARLSYKFKVSAKQIHFAWNRLGSAHKSSSTHRLEVNNPPQGNRAGSMQPQPAAGPAEPELNALYGPVTFTWESSNSSLQIHILFHSFPMLVRPTKVQPRISDIVLQSSWHLQSFRQNTPLRNAKYLTSDM